MRRPSIFLCLQFAYKIPWFAFLHSYFVFLQKYRGYSHTPLLLLGL